MGPMEIIVLLFFALMFFGSSSIPKIARTLGRGVRQMRDASNEIQREFRESSQEIRKEADLEKHLRDSDDKKEE